MIIDPLFEADATQQVDGGAGLARRVFRPREGATIVSDRVGAAEFRYFRFGCLGGTRGVRLVFERPCSAVHHLGRGLAIQLDRPGGSCIVWIPRPPSVAQFDLYGRVRLDDASATREISEAISGTEVELRVEAEQGDEIYFAAVVLPIGGGHTAREVRLVSQLRHATLLKSDWFSVGGPDELWEQLINGGLFDPRPNPSLGVRFRCQQCAFAWWSYLQRLHRETGCGLVRLLAREVAWSVRASFLEEGEWVHGFWCEQPETHLRFVLDGIHLLISEGEISGETAWIGDAATAMQQVLHRHTDRLENGNLWFLHDSLEKERMGREYTRRVLGATRGNTLCLNTHVQALTVLNRLRFRTDTAHHEEHETAYRQGLSALQTIIALRPAEVLYSALGKLAISAVSAKNCPGVGARLRRILFFRLLRRPYWWVRQTYPRIVYPNGFIERDMAASMLADDYHILNLKDLLLLYTQDEQPWMKRAIENGLQFASRLDIVRALTRSRLFIEYHDVLMLYDRLFGGIDTSVSERVARAIRERWSGVSLDAYVSDMIADDGDHIPDLGPLAPAP